MKKILYHGSDHIITNPEYGHGSYANDYGRGFYCTENIELAKEWACTRNADGYANCYELEFDGLKVLNLNQGEYSILNWLALLTRYRSYWQQRSIAETAKEYLQEYFLIDISGYDVIIGYKLGEQVVLKSQKVFSQLRFLDYEAAYAEEYYQKKMQRDKAARRQYRETKGEEARVTDLYMLDIMREGMKNHDPRLR